MDAFHFGDQLCRVIARKIQQDVATGERCRALEHLLRVIEAEKFGLLGGEHRCCAVVVV